MLVNGYRVIHPACVPQHGLRPPRRTAARVRRTPSNPRRGCEFWLRDSPELVGTPFSRRSMVARFGPFPPNSEPPPSLPSWLREFDYRRPLSRNPLQLQGILWFSVLSACVERRPRADAGAGDQGSSNRAGPCSSPSSGEVTSTSCWPTRRLAHPIRMSTTSMPAEPTG